MSSGIILIRIYQEIYLNIACVVLIIYLLCSGDFHVRDRALECIKLVLTRDSYSRSIMITELKGRRVHTSAYTYTGTYCNATQVELRKITNSTKGTRFQASTAFVDTIRRHCDSEGRLLHILGNTSSGESDTEGVRKECSAFGGNCVLEYSLVYNPLDLLYINDVKVSSTTATKTPPFSLPHLSLSPLDSPARIGNDRPTFVSPILAGFLASPGPISDSNSDSQRAYLALSWDAPTRRFLIFTLEGDNNNDRSNESEYELEKGKMIDNPEPVYLDIPILRYTDASIGDGRKTGNTCITFKPPVANYDTAEGFNFRVNVDDTGPIYWKFDCSLHPASIAQS